MKKYVHYLLTDSMFFHNTESGSVYCWDGYWDDCLPRMHLGHHPLLFTQFLNVYCLQKPPVVRESDILKKQHFQIIL